MKTVTALYFSPTGTTKTIAVRIAHGIAGILGAGYAEVDITVPSEREKVPVFGKDDIVVFASPVYIGRMPNLISPFYRKICGGGAIGIPVAVYGNRNYDDALLELYDIMRECGFVCGAAAAFVGEHSFSTVLGGGRPDRKDLECADRFAEEAAEVIRGGFFGMLEIPGRFPYSFYRATDNDGNGIDIRKAKPVTDPELCNGCGICASVCPMGAIDASCFSSVTGICIKCGACIKRCPSHAKKFTDAAYLSHLKLLEDRFSPTRREPEFFFPVRK